MTQTGQQILNNILDLMEDLETAETNELTMDWYEYISVEIEDLTRRSKGFIIMAQPWTEEEEKNGLRLITNRS